MKTEILNIDPLNIDQTKIKFASDVIKGGGLVAFPTETVYGLGANALEASAVLNIFKAKGRPSDNPLIAHVCDGDWVKRLVNIVPANAAKLMDEFWPGPLTLIMEKSSIVPSTVTAGLDTVAIRMPSHPVALALIREAGVPIAAPSANTSGRPSPTNAEHVISDLDGKIHVIIDSGSSSIGLESTVVDTVLESPVILRPGGITFEQLSVVMPDITLDKALVERTGVDKPRAPGMKYKHYAPKAKVIIVEGDQKKEAEKINELAQYYRQQGMKTGILATRQTLNLYTGENTMCMGDRSNPSEIAAAIFYAFREMDKRKVDIILAEAIERTGIGFAVMNRMMKAAGNYVINVAK